MKIYLGAFSALLVVFVFSSCQKEVNETLPDRITNADSSYLDKVIILDTTLTAGMDTVEKVYFNYDNARRLNKFTDYFFVTGYTDTTTREFFYLNNATSPYKEIYQDYTGGTGSGRSVDTVYYNYTNGLVSKDSIIEWNLTTNTAMGADVTVYSVQGNTVNIYSKSYNLVSGNYVLFSSDTSSCTTSYSGGNEVAQNRTGGYSNFNIVQAVYDNKINPFEKIIKVKYPFFGSYTGFDWQLQVNNPLSIHYQEDPSDPFQDDHYTYTYRADNYPVIVRYNSTQGWPYNKFIYFYKSL